MAGVRNVNRIVGLFLVGILGTVTAGCSPSMRVSSAWGPGLRFSEKTRTFDWKPDGRRIAGEGRPKNPNVDPLIRTAVEKELGKKGYRKVSDGKPDFWIDYLVARQVRGDPYGDPHFSDFTEGSLALYLTNPENGSLIWEGCVEGRLDETIPPQEQVKRLHEAVQVLLDKIPSYKAGK